MYLMEPTGADRRHMALSFPLHPDWHNMTPYSVHMNQEFDESLKRQAQEYYEAHIGSRQRFIAEFGKSYL